MSTGASEISEPTQRLLGAEFVALLVAVLTFGLSHSAFFLLPKYLAQELHADASTIGWVTSVAWLMNVIAVAFVGVAVDRRGRRVFAVAGAALLAATCAGFLWVDAVGPWLVALRLAHGVAFALFFVATSTLAADLAPPERLSQALGLYGSAFVATNALAPAGAEWLALRAGWPAVFATMGVLALASLALLGAVGERARVRLPHESIPGLGVVFARAGFARLLGVCALAGVTFGALLTFHQPYALSLGLERVSDFFVAYAIAALAVRALAGSLADRIGRRRVTAAALALYGVTPMLLPLLGTSGLAPAGIALGLSHGFFYPALNAIAVEGAADDERGKLMAVFNGAFNAGFALGSFALGYVAEAAGYTPVFVAAGVCSLAALGLLAAPNGRRDARA